MKTQTEQYSRPLLVLAYAMFVMVVVIIVAAHGRLIQDGDYDANIVATARNEAMSAMPPYQDTFHREYFWTLTGAIHYHLEKKGLHEAVVWLGDPGKGSYLRVNMRQIGDGAWSVRNAQMFIPPEEIGQNQPSIQSSEHHPIQSPMTK